MHYNSYNINIQRILVAIMHKKLRTIGNSWGLIIPLPILELLKVNPVLDDVELVVEKDVLTIKKYVKKEKEQ